jgi:MFS family permease
LLENKNRYRFIIQALIILVRSSIGLIWACAGPLLSLIMQEYGINRGTAGWFASSTPLVIAIVSIPAGIVLSRFSLKKTFAFGALLQAAGILTPFCNSYATLLLTRVCFAAGTAITVPVAVSIAAEWFTARELPVINGLTLSFTSLGNTVAYLATVPIVTALSWKAPLTIYGAVALTSAVAWIIFGKDRHRPEEPAVVSVPVVQPKIESSMWRVITRKPTILLAVAVMGTWCLGNAIGAWLPTYYNEVFHMSLGKASAIFAICTIVGAASNILSGILCSRIGLRKPFLIVPGIFLGISALCSFLFNNDVVIYISMAFFGLFSNIQNPALFTIPMEIPGLSPRQGAIVLYVMQAGGNFGNVVGPLLVGYLTDITGSYLPGFIICTVLSLGLLLTGLLIPETGPRAKQLRNI